uniref:LHX6 n=1 Tax=Meleagris gallopavo TaxID=9103 RepID=A0A803Y8K6_MELGA
MVTLHGYIESHPLSVLTPQALPCLPMGSPPLPLSR